MWRCSGDERGDIYSYGQCGLLYIIDGRIAQIDELITRDVEVFHDKYGIDARVFHEVQAINSATKIVSGMNLQTNERFEYMYDELLIESGASPVMPSWFGCSLSRIHTVKMIPQMNVLMKNLQNVQHVTLIGGGYISLEIAETLEFAGKAVRLIQRGQQLMKTLDKGLAKIVHSQAIKRGIEVLVNADVLGFEGEGRVQKVVTKQGTYETDLVIVATGIRPNTQFIQGIAKLENGAVIVNEKMATSLPNIYAAGDCATQFHRIKRTDDYIALGTTANKQGRVAGRNIAGKETIFKGIIGTSILKFFDLEIGMTGISEQEVEKLGHDVVCYSY